MKELGRLFRTLCSDFHTRWAKHLPEIEYYLNTTTHSSTGYSFYELHFGTKPQNQIQKLIQFAKLNAPMRGNPVEGYIPIYPVLTKQMNFSPSC